MKNFKQWVESLDASKSICWSGYERVPGTKKYDKGSCRPKKDGKKKKS